MSHPKIAQILEFWSHTSPCSILLPQWQLALPLFPRSGTQGYYGLETEPKYGASLQCLSGYVTKDQISSQGAGT